MNDPGQWTEADRARAAELENRAEIIRQEVYVEYGQRWRDEWTAPFRWLRTLGRKR